MMHHALLQPTDPLQYRQYSSNGSCQGKLYMEQPGCRLDSAEGLNSISSLVENLEAGTACGGTMGISLEGVGRTHRWQLRRSRGAWIGGSFPATRGGVTDRRICYQH
jgi:hypothetical protein